ncbi:MAG: 16S rRNA (guanine(966)-N(2))-methyltransferase RsmD [Caldimicrobium sp.]|nr:16S rRNA (guanine(966)-N(2))-methyltransferase RsmD [Caldimicrobium sp.]MDW8182248.1 16S rRNA (guanine(966)-N(2))-methyltransferase RsmD [Caldimicrobium sp.]
MKITGGHLKGRSLYTPQRKSFSIRPLRSRIRKALFDILGHDLTHIKVLDLFSGTGALGFEALSRGAEFTLFVDASPQSISLIKKNLLHLDLTEKALIKNWKLPQDLSKLKDYALKRGITFDIVFITPPYESGLSLRTLESLPREILKRGAIIMVEERATVVLPERVLDFSLRDKRIYGETAIYFYTYG